MTHASGILDTDKRFAIDPITRTIKNPPDQKKVQLIQYDHNSERFTFEVPRYVEGHDMSLSASAQVHYKNGENAGRYDADDLQVSPEDDGKVIFSWLISRNATQHVGPLTFLVKFRCYDGEDVVYEWNTAKFGKSSVGDGMDNDGVIVEQYPDVIAALDDRVDRLEKTSGAAIDPTLTLEGYPADAKAVGDALAGKQPAGDYLTEETDPTVPAWAKQPEKPTYTFDEVGADEAGAAEAALAEAKGYADLAVLAHNVDPEAHLDIRLLISELGDRLNAVADSEDMDLDQLSELVAYIKDNRELIEQVTTGKVSLSDIVDNLTTNVSDKPLSAAQGVALKQLLDAMSAGKLDASALPSAIDDALSQAKASGEFDGADGYSPIRGTDYWTAADIAEIKSYVDDAILGGAW